MAIALTAIALTAVATAQSVDPLNLLHPPADSWLTYHGDYSGQRHSNLAAITPENVGKLRQVWRFQTGQTQGIKSSPILVDGVLYIAMRYVNGPSLQAMIGARGALSTAEALATFGQRQDLVVCWRSRTSERWWAAADTLAHGGERPRSLRGPAE